MQPHSSFDALSRLVERLGADPRSVRRVEAATKEDGDGPLHATVCVSVPFCEAAADGTGPALEPVAASADGDEVRVAFRGPKLQEFPPDSAVAAESGSGLSITTRTTDARIDGGEMLLTLDVVIASVAADERDEGSIAANGEAAATRGLSAPTDAAPGSVSGGEPPRGESGGSTDESSAVERVSTSESERESADGGGAGANGVDSGANGDDSGPNGDDAVGRDDGGSDDVSGLADARDDSVPPYEDTAYLRCLYDACDTFAEMSDRIEMDVSAETVRRYMIDAGVHSPTSYRTEESDRSPAADGRSGPSVGGGSDADTDAESDPLPDEQLLADGIGLPDGLTLREVADAVVDARTVYEVQRQLGIGQDRTRRLLKQLNVLDLVLRRVSDEPERRVSYDAVTARIRQCTPDDAS
ncbi:hypothetical protein [Halobellus sp. GM3]|uniref:hypothetical protein n=1 Tax=Halobellus sp. GM3 TaxID=3458410 RepID=UPI00403E18CA